MYIVVRIVKHIVDKILLYFNNNVHVYTLVILPFVKLQNDIYHCCVYSEKLMMMDRGTVRNM